jgi:transposase-like protein
MPAPNPNNPKCSQCDRFMRKNGAQTSGAVQYRCKCGFTYTEGDRLIGRPTLGDRPLTQAELDTRYRLANPEKYREIHKKKKKSES